MVLRPDHQVGALRGPLGRSDWGSAHQAHCSSRAPDLEISVRSGVYPLHHQTLQVGTASGCDAMQVSPEVQAKMRELLAICVHMARTRALRPAGQLREHASNRLLRPTKVQLARA